MDNFEKLKKYTPYEPTPDVREHEGKIPEGAKKYEDPSGIKDELTEGIERLKEIEKIKKDTIEEINRLKKLVVASERKTKVTQSIDEDLEQLTETLEALQSEENEIRRNLPEMN